MKMGGGEMIWPALPSVVHSSIGDVPVEQVADLKDETGDDCLGIWNYGERKIKLRPDQAPPAGWQTLVHEKVHMWLSDSGVSGFLSQKQEEAICDAISTAIVAEMAGQLTASGTPPLE